MSLEDKKVAYFVDKGFEDLEFWVPVMRLREENARINIVGTGKTKYVGKHGLTASPDVQAGNIVPDHFDGAVIPGGWAPDRLRRSRPALNFICKLYEQDKIIGSICHGGQVLISAGILEGHRATGTRAIKDDLENAGATWVDKAAFQDDNLVWGRVVKDIPDFCRELVKALQN